MLLRFENLGQPKVVVGGVYDFCDREGDKNGILQGQPKQFCLKGQALMLADSVCMF